MDSEGVGGGGRGEERERVGFGKSEKLGSD